MKTLIKIGIGQGLNPISLSSEYFALKPLVRMSLRLKKDQTRDINSLHSLLSQVWEPDYKEFFNVLNSPQALLFFKSFPTPRVLSLPERVILAQLRKYECSYYGTQWGKKKVKKILELVRGSIWEGDEYLKELGLEIADFSAGCYRRWWGIKDCEIRIEEMLKRWKEEEREPVRTIPGFSKVLAGSLLSFIGNLNRFQSTSGFIAYCGLVFCRKESGSKKGRKIRKRRKRLCVLLRKNLLKLPMRC